MPVLLIALLFVFLAPVVTLLGELLAIFALFSFLFG